MGRIIFHCDLDCFFAAVEERDNPKFRGKPVIIGADPKDGKGRGVVATCNYEARRYGLHSAMPISQAYKRCSHGIYLRPNGNKYQKVSKDVMAILNNYSNAFQKVGTDEAYLEITQLTEDYKEAEKIAKQIQQEILDVIGITISIGIAPTKSLAKIASDENKPNGITIVRPNEISQFLKEMDITRIPGIGKKSKIFYYKKGIKKIGDIINASCSMMIDMFGKHGKWIWKIVNGLDTRKVKEFNEERKSISAERTFYTDTNVFNEILMKLEDINEKIHMTIEKHRISYKTITLKIRFEGFQTFTRSRTLNFHIQDKKYVLKVILELFKEFLDSNKKVRLVGIKLSNLIENQKVHQTDLLQYVIA
ncbi:MAG: DNA polymerase IV [Promethearchaeota archaeon]